ncbi:unnamed protein product [Clonostachys chloroleuca]|uniref:Amidohydrolase-related domain-containing protein n=1 Tax=Clonostachys chloroleuca TaxID=1926264 RepID=A0AA35PY34_9HYPO|nr:unnamed protein product [Clonostachys chloroleuca]
MALTTFTISDVRIFTGKEVIEIGYVTVKDGIISDVSPGSPPSEITDLVLSRPGHTVIPGLIDAHMHAQGNDLALTQSLQFGVTTVQDMHNETANVHKMKKIAAAKKDEASDFKAAGVAATIEGGWPMAVVLAIDKSEQTAADVATWPKLKSPAEAEAYVAFNLSPAGGADFIKLMHESGSAVGQSISKPSLDIQNALIKATHKAGRIAVAHCFGRADTLEMLSLGIDGLAHTFMDEPVTEEIINEYKKSGAWCNPTLALLGSFTTEGEALAKRFANDERVKDKLAATDHDTMCRCMSFATATASVQYAYETVRRLKAEGVPIIVGSDAVGPGLGTAYGATVHQEMHLLVKECGFSPQDAIRSATTLTAKVFGLKDRGEVAQGLKADLVLVEGNPTHDIDATLNIKSVWRDGILAKGF